VGNRLLICDLTLAPSVALLHNQSLVLILLAKGLLDPTSGSLPHFGDGLVFQICCEVQREHWEPPVGLELRTDDEAVVAPAARRWRDRS
jgi:hypothetical protein